jgi:FkbM family methyltransferase
MNIDYKIKDPVKLELSYYGMEGFCNWYDFEHPKHKLPPIKQLFSLYLNDYHFNKWIRPGMTCVDIGAHIGDTALPMMASCKGTVLAIEPNIYMLPFLHKNCEANEHLGKFVIATEAVTNTITDNLIFGDHNNAMINGGIIDETWDSGTAQFVSGMTGQTMAVQGLPFMNICKKYLSDEEIDNIGFIKTDTEGHDIEIIRNMRDFLQEQRPILLTEWFFGYSPADSEKLFNVIYEAGYVPHYPDTLEEADVNQHSEDLLCIHKDNL